MRAPEVDPPPWIAERVAEASAFIEYEWTAHLHTTDHVNRSDWQAEAHVYDAITRMRVMSGLELWAPDRTCRYCLIAEAERGMDDRARRLGIGKYRTVP